MHVAASMHVQVDQEDELVTVSIENLHREDGKKMRDVTYTVGFDDVTKTTADQFGVGDEVYVRASPHWFADDEERKTPTTFRPHLSKDDACKRKGTRLYPIRASRRELVEGINGNDDDVQTLAPNLADRIPQVRYMKCVISFRNLGVRPTVCVPECEM